MSKKRSKLPKRAVARPAESPPPESDSASRARPVPEAVGQMHAPIHTDAPAPAVGIITALPEEFDAVRVLLTNFRRERREGPGSGREYGLGDVVSLRGGVHRVVLARTLTMGNNSAAIRAEKLLAHFPTVQSIIMCGVAGGVPNPEAPGDHV